ncbi:unnamed protein product [Heterosigma akashiwo]
MFKRCPRHVLAGAAARARAAVPDGFLRRHMAAMAPSAEAFLTLRTDYAKSLAMICVSGYILGIGDRHLDNFLLDLTSGQLIGIDFGYAFGIGASHLPVPELLPFRLSPNLLGPLRPLDARGLLVAHMIHAMAALREGADTLTSTLDVFLHEPIVDWAGGAKKWKPSNDTTEDSAGGGGASESLSLSLEEGEEQTPWEPDRKIRNTLRKLTGYHPVGVLCDDLKKTTVKHFKSFDKLKEIALSSDCARSSFELTEVLSVADQVECLVELASDPNVALRMWQGLTAWV